MAIDLTKSSTDLIDFGDIAIDGLTAITVALTIRLNDTPLNLGSVMLKGNPWPDQVISCQCVDSNELGFAAIGSGGVLYGRKTTGLNMVNGGLYRIIAWWEATTSMEIWVNGAKEPDAVWYGAPGPPSLLVSDSALKVGHRGYAAANAFGADYGEPAIWNHRVPDWVLEGYGNGMSPRFYREGGIVHSSLRSLKGEDLADQWNRNDGTNTGGTNSAHPRVFYPPVIIPRVCTVVSVFGPPPERIGAAVLDPAVVRGGASVDAVPVGAGAGVPETPQRGRGRIDKV